MQPTSQHSSPQRPGQPPQLQAIYLLAGIAGFLATIAIVNTIATISTPFSHPIHATNVLQESLTVAIFWTGTCLASIHYIRYRRRLARLGQIATPRPWHLRTESRAVLYLFAILQFSAFPVACWQAFSNWNAAGSVSVTSVFQYFPPKGILAPLFGIALIFYDRRRATRERRISGNLCLTCGYDLRASPIQCPECGQAVV